MTLEIDHRLPVNDVHYYFLCEILEWMQKEYKDTKIHVHFDFWGGDQFALRITFPVDNINRGYTITHGDMMHSLHACLGTILLQGSKVNSRFKSPFKRTSKIIPRDLFSIGIDQPDAIEQTISKVKWLVDKIRRRDGW